MGEYGTYIRKVVDSSGDDHGQATAINMNAAVSTAAAEALLKTAREPMCVDRVGYMPTTAFAYNGLTVQGVLSIYKYPGGDASKKVLLATIKLVDGALVGTEYVSDIPNTVQAAVSPYAGLADLGIADLAPGDKVAIWISTQATGGTYIAGAFQPFLCWHNRAETENNMPSVVNLTPVQAQVNEPIP